MNYGGSQIFAGLTDYVKLSVDQMNFITSQIIALGLATLFRTVLHPSKTTPACRQAFALVVGIFIGYFCYGYQALHLAILPALCYIVIITQNPLFVHGLVMIVALTYLSCVHIHRQIYDYGFYGLDISGPLMVITQKVTTLAFSLHDGITKVEKDMTKTQNRMAVMQTPGPLEYFSYMLMFPSLMAGPAIFYKDYTDFIEGKAYNVTHTQVYETKSTTIVMEPSPVRAVVKKVIVGLICAIIFVKYLPMFPVSRIKDDNFIENTSLSYKFWYLTVCTTLVRFKYYFAWTLADAICNNCGIGFNGYRDDGTTNWDKVSNVNILKFEFAKSLKESIEGWNTGTNTWLRTIVYERTRRSATLLTYALSAIWHGFYPGYYLMFASGALFTFAARTVRKRVRWYFTESFEARLFYDILTFGVTHLVLAYITFPFVLLEFSGSVRLYNKMYWCLHLAAVGVLIVLPMVAGAKNNTVSCSSNNNKRAVDIASVSKSNVTSPITLSSKAIS